MATNTHARKQRPKPHNDRRQDVRLAGGGEVAAAVIDGHDQPVVILRAPGVLNVSAGGVAITTPSRVDAGERLSLCCETVEGVEQPTTRFEVEALESVAYHDGRNKVRCRLIQGHVPVQLVHGW